MKRGDWIGGNSLHVLVNGEEYFPAVFAAIEAARREVLVETFILFEDKVGLALHAVLLGAAKRGVRVDVTVDGFGSPALSTNFVGALTEAGVRLHVFDPPPRQHDRALHASTTHVDSVQPQQRPARGKGLRRHAVGLHEHFLQSCTTVQRFVGVLLPIIEIAGDDHQRIVRQTFDQPAQALHLFAAVRFT